MLCGLLTAGACASFAGCASPFRQGSGTPGTASLADSILVHNLSDGRLLTRPATMPVDQGVHELLPRSAGRPAAPHAMKPVVPDGTRRGGAKNGQSGSAGVSMSLVGAIADALRHNLAIKVESYTPAVSQTRIVAAEAAFDPTFISETQYQHLDQPTPFPQTLGSVAPVGINSEDQVNSQMGVKKLLSTGGSVSLIGSDNYQDFHSSASLPPDINPSHTADMALELKQPLLRGFGASVNRAEIYIARRNQQIALSTFRSRVIKTVAHVEITS